MKKVFFTYAQYGELISKLTDQILKDPRSKEIECIYGIPRGGLPIAIHLSHALNIPCKYGNFNFFTVPYKTIMIVDDISDTGKSFMSSLRAGYATNENLKILTAALHIKAETKVVPDFYIDEYDTKFWLVYPWERKDEDTIADYQNI